MIRKAAVVLALAGAAAIVASFPIPADFAWNGMNSFTSCIATAHYASGPEALFVWYGFAAGVLYPYVWAIAAALAMATEWRAPSNVAPLLPAGVTTAGCALAAVLGILLLAMRETWPSPAIQWTAVIASSAHAAILWTAFRRAASECRTATVVLVGAVPFVFLQVALAVSSQQYGSPVIGFGLGAAGAVAIILASVVMFRCRIHLVGYP